MKKNKKILVGLIAVLIIINSCVVVAKADNTNNISVDNLISSSGLIADNFDNQTIKTYITQFASNNPCLYNIDFSNNERVSSWLEYINSHELPVIPEFSNDYYGAYIRYFDNQDRIDLMCFSSSEPVFYFAFINEGGKVRSLGSDLKGRNIHYIRSNGSWNVTIDSIGIENVYSESADYYQNNYLTDVINLIGSSTIIYAQGFSNSIGATPLTLEGLSSILANGGSEPFDYAYHKFSYDGSSLSDVVVPDVPQEETFKNHMYLTNAVIGLTNGTEPINSSVYIQCAVDDYLKKYSDNCTAYVSYEFVFDGSDNPYNSYMPRDANFEYVEVYPLNALLNGVSEDITSLFSNMPDENGNYRNARQLYNQISDLNAVYSKTNISSNGFIGDLVNQTTFNLFGFKLIKCEQTVNDTVVNLLPYINDYSLTVSFYVGCEYDSESAVTGSYSQKINFKNGQSNLINADGLNNDNPWYDESVPEGSTINSNNGTSYGSGSNVAYGGSSNLNVNFQSYKGTSLNGVSAQDTEDLYQNHISILNTLDTAKDLIDETRDENSSFMQFLSDCCAPFYEFTPIKLSITFMLLLGIIVFIFHLV